MPFRVRVEDFQSIADATLEVRGLTVVTGANNTGKTALIRALFGAFTNARGTRFVREGTTQSRVTLTLEDGRRLVWEKGEGINRYEIDGKAYARVGAGPPVELATWGVRPIKAGGREIWPQFAHQFVGQIFLLDEPGSVLAEALADVDRVGQLNEALRLSQSDRRARAAELKVRQEDADTARAMLDQYAGLDAVVAELQELDTVERRLEVVRRTVSELKDLLARRMAALQEVARLLPIRATSWNLDGDEVRRVEARLDWVRSVEMRRAAAAREVAVFSAVRGVSYPAETDAARMGRVSSALEVVRELRRRREEALLEREKALAAATWVRTHEPPRAATSLREDVERVAVLRALAERYANARKAFRDLHLLYEESLGEAEAARMAVESELGVLRYCPTCARPSRVE